MVHQQILFRTARMVGDVAMAQSDSSVGKDKDRKSHNPHAVRETVESVIVAFILAFLFRAFVAEAFVIPTGSMAPTLMGAHKDTICEHCGTQFQSTASPEFDKEDNGPTNNVAVGGTCAICRATNAFDLAGNRNHATFSGDRILVSKFDYLFRDPKRWDVLVFKFPTDARMNYIKRLVGLPGEHLHIEGGDVYVRTSDGDPWQLARKPPDKALAMMQVVSDTSYRARDLVAAGWPSLWQPLPGADRRSTDAWQPEHTPDSWSAHLPSSAAGERTQWLRYYHKYLDSESWQEVTAGRQLPPIDAYSVNLITDFLAYNTTRFARRTALFDRQGRLRPEITSEHRALDLVPPNSITFDGLTGLAQDGLHWVGDLATEFDVEVKGSTGTLSFDLVEFGIHYRCDIDVATGKATLHATDNGQAIAVFSVDGEPPATAQAAPAADTAVKGPGRHRVRYANIDDRLMLWIDDSLVEFDQPTEYDSHRFRAAEARRPYWTAADPLDAAPIGIGGQGVELMVHRARVWRDIYYIAIRPNIYSDYNTNDLMTVINSIDQPQIRSLLQRDSEGPINVISWVYANPELWATTPLFAKRGYLDYELGKGEFFPMGDNSAASSDARDWSGHHYVERRFLIGKALLVFWPHRWNAPVPYPNFARMGRIR